MSYFELLIKTVKEVEPAIMKMSEEEYQKHKHEILKDAADTGQLYVYNFMEEVFTMMDGKRAALK